MSCKYIVRHKLQKCGKPTKDHEYCSIHKVECVNDNHTYTLDNNDILYYIIFGLTDVNTMISLGSVNSYVSTLLRTDSFWKSKMRRDMPLFLSASNKLPYFRCTRPFKYLVLFSQYERLIKVSNLIESIVKFCENSDIICYICYSELMDDIVKAFFSEKREKNTPFRYIITPTSEGLRYLLQYKNDSIYLTREDFILYLCAVHCLNAKIIGYVYVGTFLREESYIYNINGLKKGV